VLLIHKIWFRLLLAPIIAGVWLSVASVWALMQGKRDAVTLKTLAFGFVLVTLSIYIMEIGFRYFESPVWMGLGTICIVLSMWWFRNRLKRKDG
jgi:multidrug transporter EmrE-like cation transporter